MRGRLWVTRGLEFLSLGEHEGDNDKAHADNDSAYYSRSNKSSYEGRQIAIFHFFISPLYY